MVILGAAVLRLLTAQIALPVFDIDPTIAPGGQPGLAPGPSLVLDGLVLLAAAVGLVGEGRSGRRIHGWVIAASLLPVLAMLPRINGPIDDLWRGATWTSSVVAGVVLAHLLRDRFLRRVALAILLGALAVVAVRGIGQVMVEHPRMVEAFAAMRSDLLTDRGWQEGSASTRVFEDRLRQREATGWFGLANVFSSAMVVASLLAAAVAVGAWSPAHRFASGTRSGHGLRPAGVPAALLAIAALGLLLMNGSKGAVASLALGALVWGVGATVGDRWSMRRGPTLRVALAWGLPLLAVAAVMARGLLLPEGFANERSVLFRWHYLIDAGAVFARAPLLGVGPSGFQQAMVAVRPPHHAEEVVSAHNVGADWLTGLGVLGAAWIVVLACMLRWAALAVVPAQAAADAPTSPPPPESAAASRDAGRLVLLALLLAAGVALWIESTSLDATLALVRFLGLGAGVAVAAGVFRAVDLSPTEPGVLATALPGRSVRWGLFAAALALVVHAQIEMTFWLHGAVPWAMAVLATAGPAIAGTRVAGAQEPVRRRIGAVPGASVIMVAIAAGALLLGVRAWRSEATLRRAAVPLERLGEVRAIAPLLASRTDGNTIAALESSLIGAGAPRETVAAIVGRLTSASQADRSIALRTLDEAMGDLDERARLASIEILGGAATGSDTRPLTALVEQSVRVAPRLSPIERDALLAEAERNVDAALAEAGSDHRLLRARAEILEAAGPRRAVDAQRAWARLAEGDPCSLALQRRLAESAARAGDVEAERTALLRMLELDEALRLDPRRRLTPEQRAEIERRLGAGAG